TGSPPARRTRNAESLNHSVGSTLARDPTPSLRDDGAIGRPRSAGRAVVEAAVTGLAGRHAAGDAGKIAGLSAAARKAREPFRIKDVEDPLGFDAAEHRSEGVNRLIGAAEGCGHRIGQSHDRSPVGWVALGTNRQIEKAMAYAADEGHIHARLRATGSRGNVRLACGRTAAGIHCRWSD